MNRLSASPSASPRPPQPHLLHPHDPPTPTSTTTTRYRKLQKIGKGSFGDVYRGVDSTNGDTVAIKVINLESADDEIDDIRSEIATLTECSSDYITRYVTSYTVGEELHIVMEYLGGGSVRDLLGGGPLDESVVCIIVRELLKAIEYLHDQHKIHRDIKVSGGKGTRRHGRLSAGQCVERALPLVLIVCLVAVVVLVRRPISCWLWTDSPSWQSRPHTAQHWVREAACMRAASLTPSPSACVGMNSFGVTGSLTQTLQRRNTFVGTPYWSTTTPHTASHTHTSLPPPYLSPTSSVVLWRRMAPEVIQQSSYNEKGGHLVHRHHPLRNADRRTAPPRRPPHESTLPHTQDQPTHTGRGGP